MAQGLILVIDDEEDVLDRIRFTLARDGYDVLTATTGKAGLALARARQPSLIVLDLILPHEDALEVYSVLKSDPKTAEIPIMVLSASDPQKDVVSGRPLGPMTA
jgi:DNA-binding response OmpR family regulator